MSAIELDLDHELTHPDRRSFIRTLGAAGLGLAAAGLGSACAKSKPAGAVLDPDGLIRVGMIGTAGHTYVVLGDVGKVKGAQIAAYAFEDGDWEYNEGGSRRGGSYALDDKRKWAEKQPWFGPKTKLYETYQEMLDKEKLDLAVVCLPYSRIPYAAAAAARAGVHIISEKPVATTFSDLDMLEAAVKNSGVKLTALFTIRFSPAFYTIKQAVAAGKIGRPIMGRGQKSYKWGEDRPWFYKVREIYGSSILWVGIHAIDYIYWSMGLDVKRVSAFHGNLAHPDFPGCQDEGVVCMEMEGGATAAVTFDYLRPETASTHGDDRLRVIGSAGVVEKKELDERVEIITQEAAPAELPLVEPPGLFADFCGYLRGQNDHIVAERDPFRVTRICIAATQAADEGRVVEV